MVATTLKIMKLEKKIDLSALLPSVTNISDYATAIIVSDTQTLLKTAQAGSLVSTAIIDHAAGLTAITVTVDGVDYDLTPSDGVIRGTNISETLAGDCL